MRNEPSRATHRTKRAGDHLTAYIYLVATRRTHTAPLNQSNCL
nr:MAG TPA: hypothetical protein [Caudoviricetes sp.]